MRGREKRWKQQKREEESWRCEKRMTGGKEKMCRKGGRNERERGKKS